MSAFSDCVRLHWAQNGVHEVAARFTLDAMPGKQMSIDADMRA
ncbi:MAG: FHIPEP family type III secretion protein, partial [Clostridia bacterium]|nr:FHIPEP family type III secretion protein [Clostridia bacterium]